MRPTDSGQYTTAYWSLRLEPEWTIATEGEVKVLSTSDRLAVMKIYPDII